MSLLRKWISKWPQCCSYCGSLQVRSGLFCEFCLEKINEQRSFEKHCHPTYRQVPIYSLFNWEKDESLLKNKLIVGLKGTKTKNEWNYWSYEFFRERLKWSPLALGRNEEAEMPLIPGRCVFIPVPGSDQDHAWNFAKNLAELYQAEVCSAFTKKKVQKIKKLSLQERKKQLELEFHEILSKNWNSQVTLIIVDDVLTTGTTTEKMIEKLSQWKVEIWILASRRIVAPQSQ